MINRYNSIAFLYSPLANLVYGNALQNIQVSLLPFINKEGKLLLIGGGTGAILHAIFQHSGQINVDYMEASSTMLKKTQTRFKDNGRISYIHSSDIDSLEGTYDAIMLPFVLDTLTSEQLDHWVLSLHLKLKDDGQLLITDFYKPTNWWQASLLNATILFFRVFTSHVNTRLYNVFAPFERYSFKHLKTREIKKGFLRSSLYKRL